MSKLLMALAKALWKRWYWEHVQPRAIVIQPVREVAGETVKLDVRNFFVNPDNWELQEIVKLFKNLGENELVTQLLLWVRTSIKPITESKSKDFWQLPHETLTLKTGDCEDQAVLLANLLRAAGVEDWKVRLNAGKTSQGPHVWCTIFNVTRWRVLDPVLQGAKYGEVWFSWAAHHAFSTKENIEKWQVS